MECPNRNCSHHTLFRPIKMFVNAGTIDHARKKIYKPRTSTDSSVLIIEREEPHPFCGPNEF